MGQLQQTPRHTQSTLLAPPMHSVSAQNMLRGAPVIARRSTRAHTASTVVRPQALLKQKPKPKAGTKPASGGNQWSLKRTMKEKSLGGIGTELSKDVRPGNFSRENEKFVGRMAMIDMAAAVIGEANGNGGVLSQLSIEAGISFIGRLAMLAFAGVIVVEAFTGNGVLGQLGVETGLPTGFEEEALAGGAAFFALSAAFPSVLALVNGSKDE